MWIAFNLVSLHLQKQLIKTINTNDNVVNCFQFSIFAFAKTTVRDGQFVTIWLWIAFNLVSLHLQKQQAIELAYDKMVVNCFQFSIFAFAKTTYWTFSSYRKVLWIAFNLVSLHLQKQQFLQRYVCWKVVNCFQFSIFAFAKTTTPPMYSGIRRLWIAFNLVSLHLQKQLITVSAYSLRCCELLSI